MALDRDQIDNPHVLSPIERRPILAITEESDEQQEVFFDNLPMGAKLRVFGSAHTHPVPPGMPTNELMHWAVAASPEELLSEPPTNYRRWWNSSWYSVEEGGQRRAGDWTAADDARLRALVNHAHQLGYGFGFTRLTASVRPKTEGGARLYNFGSKDAVTLRWKAAIATGVNLIATDQYESLALYMKQYEKAVRSSTTEAQSGRPLIDTSFGLNAERSFQAEQSAIAGEMSEARLNRGHNIVRAVCNRMCMELFARSGHLWRYQQRKLAEKLAFHLNLFLGARNTRLHARRTCGQGIHSRGMLPRHCGLFIQMQTGLRQENSTGGHKQEDQNAPDRRSKPVAPRNQGRLHLNRNFMQRDRFCIGGRRRIENYPLFIR